MNEVHFFTLDEYSEVSLYPVLLKYYMLYIVVLYIRILIMPLALHEFNVACGW